MPSNIIPVANKFNQRLIEFVSNLQKLVNEKRDGSAHKISYEMGSKYAKIVIGSFGNQSVHCFVDFSGNIYKANSWKAPDLKHIRGNIFDENYGIGTAVNEYGAIYLR